MDGGLKGRDKSSSTDRADFGDGIGWSPRRSHATRHPPAPSRALARDLRPIPREIPLPVPSSRPRNLGLPRATPHFPHVVPALADAVGEFAGFTGELNDVIGALAGRVGERADTTVVFVHKIGEHAAIIGQLANPIGALADPTGDRRKIASPSRLTCAKAEKVLPLRLMNTHFMPRADPAFHTWQTAYTTAAAAHAAALDLTPADIAALQSASQAWDTAFGSLQTAEAAYRAAVLAKDKTRAALEALIRTQAGVLQARPATTDTQRAALGLTVPGARPSPRGSVTTCPVVEIRFPTRLRHTLRWTDETTPTSRARPANASGCEIWAKVGSPAPTDPADLHFVAFATTTPRTFIYEGPQGGQPAYYKLRWHSKNGTPGPWSHTHTATIVL